ncbi:MAG: glycosyltransferase [Candidatus Eremiobacteraeota bacterium]|nr:glycosyltransferase [Candidatus Eremiobacteraeota bacterium]
MLRSAVILSSPRDLERRFGHTFTRGPGAWQQKTRVAFVDQAGAVAGGAERTLATLLAFTPEDLKPTVILFEDGAFADELRRMPVAVEILRAPGSFATSKRERVRAGAVFDTFGQALRLARRLRELRIDVVYSNTMKAHFVCALAARLARIPCVMHFHDIVDGTVMHALRAAARLGSVERVACAHAVADAVGLERTTVSYGPIVLEAYRGLPRRDAARDALGLPKDVPVVALVGRINRWKGHDRFVRIAAAVNRVTPAHFAIVGAPIFRDADFVAELEALVRRLGIEQRVSFVPWVDDVRSVFAAIDLNVNCSTREPFGRTIVEAAAAGVPSVCFDDSGASEIVLDGYTGGVVAAGDEDRMAHAILEWLPRAADEEIRARVRHSATRFEARAIADQVAGVVRRAAHSRARQVRRRPSAAPV